MRIGILSFAHPHAFGYIRALSVRSDVELRVTDPDHARRPGEAGGPETAAVLGVRYADDLDALLAWEPDGVIVCTENAAHRSAVEALAEAGADVLCEKPLATSTEDADAMIAACERAGVILMTAYPVRFSPAFAALKEAVDTGTLGAVRSVMGANNGRLPADRAWFSDPELAGGGAVMDHTVHIADLLDVLMPDTTATSVYARANRIMHADRAGAETGGLVSIAYGDGVIATIDCSWSMPEHNPVWEGSGCRCSARRGSRTWTRSTPSTSRDSRRPTGAPSGSISGSTRTCR